MARRKGKSERRIKDWFSRYVGGQDDKEDIARRQKLSAQAIKLQPGRTDGDSGKTDIGIESMPKADGMIIGFYPGGVIVRVAAVQLLCAVAKTYRAAEGSSALAVGDDVTVALTRRKHTDASETDKDRADGMILSRKPRRSALARPRPRSGKRRDAYDDETFDKIMVANMDALLIVTATQQPHLSRGLIDRFLIIAERGELAPILIVNKIDLGKSEDAAKILDDFSAMGINMFFCSAVTDKGLDEIRSALHGKRSVLAGASGVGKSTLINAIIPGANAATRTIRKKDNRGRHTTSASVVYDLPQGGIIVDTPGIRELGMQLKTDELPWYFPEFENIAPNCRFNNCTHTHEPNCAIRLAVEDGTIPERRYQSYLRLLESLSSQ